MGLTIEREGDVLRVHGGTVSASTQILLEDEETIAISKIKWVGFSTAAHKAELTDGAGKSIWKETADAPGTNGTPTVRDDFDPPLRCNGLKVLDLDSGELYIYRYSL